jgi:hypothetical protein
MYQSRAQYALVVFDREGCGAESLSRESLESHVEAVLHESGWASRCSAVVIDPELEAWVWSDSPAVDQTLGWTGSTPPLRQWLVQKGFVDQEPLKPLRPKEALIAALRFRRKRQSASLFAELASKVGLSRCTDPAFLKLKYTLRNWFPSD